MTTARAGIGARDGYSTSPVITAGSAAGTFQVIAEVAEGPARAVFTGTTLPQAAITAEITGGNYQFGSAGRISLLRYSGIRGRVLVKELRGPCRGLRGISGGGRLDQRVGHPLASKTAIGSR